MKRLAVIALVAAGLAGCGSGSPYSYSPQGADNNRAAAAQPACTTVTTTSGYLVYRC